MRGTRQWQGVLFVVVALMVSAACQKTFRGSVSQPNPLRVPNETLRSSEAVVIVTGDMELNMPRGVQADGETVYVHQRYPLNNMASFTVVSRDRLRFHVQIEHKWKEWADLATWDAYLIDDQGHRYVPEVLDSSKPMHVVSMWDYETRTMIRNHFNDVVGILRDGHRHRKALGSLSVFRGRGDFVFYARDIFTPDIKRLTLVIERNTLAFAFTWKFAEDGKDQDKGKGWPGEQKARPTHVLATPH